jgi:hypothetical protein
VLQAPVPLAPGDPVTVTPQPFMGVGMSAAQTAITNFTTAIGGSKNTAAAPQSGGFRTITWDGVKLDGTDFGGGANTTVVNPNKTVIIPKNRFIGQGVYFGDPYAVSGDGFTDVNPNAAGLFTPFSSPNIFAMANGENTIDMSFVVPTGNNGTPVPAVTRGFGAIFLNVEQSGSSIEYFDGQQSLGSFPVPVGTQGQPEFLGELFPNAVVTNVRLTLGNSSLFDFNGVMVTPGGDNIAPNNLVATDDFDYAEPVAASSIPPTISGAAGVANSFTPVSAVVGTALPANTVVATFNDMTMGATAANFTAVINWGDGHITNATVVADGKGGFNVDGSNTFLTAGMRPISVDVEKLDAAGSAISLTNTAQIAAASTATKLVTSAASSQLGQALTLTATVTASGATPDGGFVEFLDGSRIVGVTALTGGTATLTTTSLTAGPHSIQAVFLGNTNFNTSTSTGVGVNVLTDVTSQFRITLGAIKGRGGKFTQVDTLVNTGGQLLGPIDLVLLGLSSKVKLLGAGTTKNFFVGSPFIVVTGGAAAHNQSLPITLIFKAKSKKALAYTPRVLAGVGQP